MKQPHQRSRRTSKLGPAGIALDRQLTATRQDRIEFEQTRATVEASANLGLALEAVGVSRIELARRLGVDRSSVTRLLQGGNVSIERLAAAAHAIGLSVHVSFGAKTDDMHVSEPKGVRVPKAAKRARLRK